MPSYPLKSPIKNSITKPSELRFEKHLSSLSNLKFRPLKSNQLTGMLVADFIFENLVHVSGGKVFLEGGIRQVFGTKRLRHRAHHTKSET